MFDAEYMREAANADNLPEPSGYKVLIALPPTKDTTNGGVYLPDELRDRESTATTIGYVVDMGPDAYADGDKFPSGPYCSIGDYIIIRPYSGTRFKVDGREYRLINDDTPEAVVENPATYERAF